MNSDLSAIAILLPRPLLDRLESLRQSRNLSSIQEALLIVLSEYFANQPQASQAAPAGDLKQIEARLFRTEALLAALSDRVDRLEAHTTPDPINSINRNVIDRSAEDDADEIDDEPDEVMQSFLEPEHQSASAQAGQGAIPLENFGSAPFGRNLGWTIQPNGKVQPLTYEEIEEEPDEILYDFLEPGQRGSSGND